ncbi:MAG: ankyrin repeat domain-containing protein [Chlamydiota bacterium]
MSLIQSSIESRYNLSQEFWKENKQPCIMIEASIYDLDFAIMHHIEPLVKAGIAFYKEKKSLNRKTLKCRFTPLHIAAISGNQQAVKLLMENGVEKNSRDKKNWAPIHHAALAGNQQMIDLLIHLGADPEIKTPLGATYKDIGNLLNPPEIAPNVMWKDGSGKERLITREEFAGFTSANFTVENKLTQKQLFSQWENPPKRSEIEDELVFAPEFRKKYLNQKEEPIHLLKKVMKDSKGMNLASSPGIGLFSRKSMKAREIIGEYMGMIEDESVSNNYSLTTTNAKDYRNQIPHINDGFVNCVLIPIHRVKGLAKRSLFVAAEPIAEGEQFCWNYGFDHSVKVGPYVELRGREMRKFIKKNNIKDLHRCLLLTGTSGELSFEEFVKAEKLRYILSTPSTLFQMALEDSVEPSTVEELHSLAYKMYCLPQDSYPLLKLIPKIALEFKDLIKRLEKCFPETAKSYFDFLSKLSEKKGIILTLNFADQANRYLEKKLVELYSHIDLREEWKNSKEWKKVDLSLLEILDKNFFKEALKFQS